MKRMRNSTSPVKQTADCNPIGKRRKKYNEIVRITERIKPLNMQSFLINHMIK